jgi:hypothetical protein
VSTFLTELNLIEIGDKLWRVHESLVYESDLLTRIITDSFGYKFNVPGRITVPEGFVTDLASVPRVPIIYYFWGGRCHREAVIHDYLYRIDSDPVVSFSMANKVFLEAAKSRGKSLFIRYPMFWGVCLGGIFSYHKKSVKEGVI